MPTFHEGSVTEVLSERPGLQRVQVAVDGAEPARAYVLSALTGPVAVEDRVVVNTTAVDLGLGTGGWHVVHWNLSRPAATVPGGGHVMKLRYTSLQADVGVAEEHQPDAPTDLGGVPVVACSVHSQVGVVAAVLGAVRPGTRVAYVMTDGGALPLALSDLVHGLRQRDLLVGSVTAGNAFGGDHEAVSIPSALARGPPRPRRRGDRGRHGPRAGSAPAPTWASAASTRPWSSTPPPGWAATRWPACGPPPATPGPATRASATTPPPCSTPPGRGSTCRWSPGSTSPSATATAASRSPTRRRARPCPGPGLTVTTMGRGPEADALFFAAAGAAGVHAASLLAAGPSS